MSSKELWVTRLRSLIGEKQREIDNMTRRIDGLHSYINGIQLAISIIEEEDKTSE